MKEIIELIELMQSSISSCKLATGEHNLNADFDLVVNNQEKCIHLIKKSSTKAIKHTALMIASSHPAKKYNSNIANISSLYKPESISSYISSIKSELDFHKCTLDSYEELEFQYSTVITRSDIFIIQCLLYSIDFKDIVYMTNDFMKYNYIEILRSLKDKLCQN